MVRMLRTAAFAFLIGTGFATPAVHAQTEFFADGLVYSGSGFIQKYEIEDFEVSSFGLDLGGMATPQFGFSLGFGQASLSDLNDGFSYSDNVTSLSLVARFVANQAETKSPLTADIAVGVGYTSVRNEGEISGLIGGKLALTLSPEQPILVAPSLEAAIAFPFFFSDAQQTTTLSPGLSVGLRVAPSVVLFARPSYTFAFGNDQAFEALGVSFGAAFLN